MDSGWRESYGHPNQHPAQGTLVEEGQAELSQEAKLAELRRRLTVQKEHEFQAEENNPKQGRYGSFCKIRKNCGLARSPHLSMRGRAPTYSKDCRTLLSTPH